MEKTLTISHANGLHARPATKLVKIASSYRSDIVIRYRDTKINAKKLLSLMKAGIKNGDEITLCVNGEDEELAMQALEHFFVHEME